MQPRTWDQTKTTVFERLAAMDQFSARKINRWLTTLILFAIGCALVVAAWRWAYGAELPKLPGEALVLGALPYLQSTLDNLFRTWQTQSAIHANAPSVNPHGGPAAP